VRSRQHSRRSGLKNKRKKKRIWEREKVAKNTVKNLVGKNYLTMRSGHANSSLRGGEGGEAHNRSEIMENCCNKIGAILQAQKKGTETKTGTGDEKKERKKI